jgi:hypothetical protein
MTHSLKYGYMRKLKTLTEFTIVTLCSFIQLIHLTVRRFYFEPLLQVMFVFFCCVDLPFFTIRPAPVYRLYPGQTITLPCIAEGDPKPIVHWRKAS